MPAGPFSADEVSIVGRRIIVRYLQDAYSLVRVFDLNGKVQYDVKLPGLGTAEGFTAAWTTTRPSSRTPIS